LGYGEIVVRDVVKSIEATVYQKGEILLEWNAMKKSTPKPALLGHFVNKWQTA